MTAGLVVPPVTIRRGVPSDAALLAELGARTFTETFLADNDPANVAAFVAATYGLPQQAAELADPATTLFVAEQGDEAVGFAKLHAGAAPPCVGDADAALELARLYVSREQLGRGAGEALMAQCVEYARESGCRTLWLGVWERNARAQRFYRRWGFEVVGEHVFQVGTDPQTDVLMRRLL